MAGIMIYSENTGLLLELAEAARQLKAVEGREYKVLSINQEGQAAELAARGLNVYQIQDSRLMTADTAAMASALRQAAEQLESDTILLSSNRRGKELAGRTAEAWGAGCLTDVKELIADEGGRAAWSRNALGGATVATQVITSPRRVVAISPRAFKPSEDCNGGMVEPIQIQVQPSGLRLVEERVRAEDSADIQTARRLIVVGQGVERYEDLALVEKIALSLQAEIACSKPVASDKKWLPEDRIIGLSGKSCQPDLAIILGVSGQVQFTAGIREARVIVSINSDENAFMNKMSDYILVGDLQEVLPELEKALGYLAG